MDARVVTVTGPSGEVTEKQEETLRGLLRGASLVRHGLCVGADELAHRIAVEFGIPVHGHPGVNARGESPKRFYVEPCPGFLEWAAEPYLDRNGTMVARSTEVAALVRSPKWYRSGEWSTISRALARALPVTTVLPDGSTTILR